ncbi:MAG: hypothetical protein F6K38_05910 [Moorea sp. SIO3B2]|uniref:hypothetical protein n=1 Tax=Moorena producens TaxID=1155739 RepID=UPI0003099A7D|nr:hypothetical protein [Moorena producens]NEP31027.1 hypothetical protein [Moorena sp. SIO3B2]
MVLAVYNIQNYAIYSRDYDLINLAVFSLMRYKKFLPSSRFPIPDSRFPIPDSLFHKKMYLT